MADEMENGTGMPEEGHDHDAMTPEELGAHNEEFHPEGGDVVPAPEEDDMDMGGGTEPKPMEDAPEEDEEAV